MGLMLKPVLKNVMGSVDNKGSFLMLRD